MTAVAMLAGLSPAILNTLPAAARTSSPYERLVLSHRPVAYWPLGESSGDFLDASGDGNTAAAHGGITYGQAGPLRKGGTTSVSFDGSTAYAETGDSPSLDRPTSAITLEAWVKPTAGTLGGGNFLYVIQKAYTSHTPPYYQYGLSLIDTPTYPNATDLSLSIGGSPIFFVVDHSGWSYGVWNHLVATYDGTQMRVYVNGLQVGDQAQTGSLDHYATALDIGAYVNFPKTTDYLYAGDVAAVAVYSSALTARQVHADYAFRVPRHGAGQH